MHVRLQCLNFSDQDFSGAVLLNISVQGVDNDKTL